MKLVQLTKEIPHQGLSEGDVINVDQRSAKVLIDRGDAKEYEPPAKDEKPEPTIDDIPSTAKRGRAVMSAVRVGAPDPGPVAVTVDEAEDPGDGESVELDALPDDARRLPDPPGPHVAEGTGEPNVGTEMPADGQMHDIGQTDKPAKKAAAKKPPAAPGAQPAGGDAGGGDPK